MDLSILALLAISAGFALTLALVVGIAARPLGEALGLLDFPDTDGGRKRHDQITPLVGGLAVAGATFAAALLAGRMALAPAPALHLFWLAGAIAAMFFIGAFDDRFHLSPGVRLTAALAVLLLVTSNAPDFSLAFLRFAGQDQLMVLGPWGDAFSLLCLLGLLNAVNMADGKNGIVLGMGLIWTVVLAAHMPAEMLPVLVAAGVALAVMWCFNMTGRLFLGDGGSYAISALFGLLAIYAYNHDFEAMRAGDVAVMFAIPVFDTMRLMAARLLQRRSPFEGDRDHLHHHLHARIGWPIGLWVYLGIVALPNAGALLWPAAGWLWLILAFVLYVTVMAATWFRSPAVNERPAA
jgi:UDP-GlcNAc:undecaprenyl-phosphate GlcNAc-1-phosphate transferase